MADQLSSLPPPSDPYRWHESVLSTRSLSYMSTISALGNNAVPSPLASRNASIAHLYPPPQSNMDEDSDYELEVAGRRERAKQMTEALPSSVAHSALFALPLEIRERIWRHCVVAEDTEIDWPPPTPHLLGLAPQLLLTCKIIFAEAATILYAQNRFGFSHPTDANIFVRAMTSPSHSGMIQSLNLTIHTKDTRLWLPYIGSNNHFRSLKHDFPNLKELIIRYKSNRWNHNAPIDVNLRLWSEDRHLEEITDSLRQLYFPPHQPSGFNDQQFGPIQNLDEAETEIEEALRNPKLRAKLQAKWQERNRLQRNVIRVRIICMCRIHLTQFLALTAQPTQEEVLNSTPWTLANPRNLLPNNDPPRLLRHPVVEGTEFLGFTSIDFKLRGAKKPDMVLANGATAQVARTPFLNRKSVGWALEVYAFNN